jgi:hypothetical protein
VDVAALLAPHPAVTSVRLGGSRARGKAHALSDWDWEVRTSDYDAVARDLPGLLAPLEPLAALWDPYSDVECYMLMLRGPTKVDVLFPDEPRKWDGPWRPSAKTLPRIDAHFWDWILWTEQKRRSGKADVVEKSLADMHRLMLAPMGVLRAPTSVTAALDAYLEARMRLEEIYGIKVPRALQREVEPALTEPRKAGG